MLVEMTCLTSEFTNEDIRARSVLSQSLRLSELPNNGYLKLDKTNPDNRLSSAEKS